MTAMIDTFDRYFTIQVAKTPEEKKQVYEIRYNVYCQEFGYEQRSDGLENDIFDTIAVHCLITHKATGAPAGCTRLIPASEHQLPIEQQYPYTSILNELGIEDRSTVCEISRLAVDTSFRRRNGETFSKYGLPNGDKRSGEIFSLITLSALLAGIALADINNTPNGLAMMEPFLPRLLHRSCINFKQVCPIIEYHGQRAGYFANAEVVRSELTDDLKAFYHYIGDKLTA